MTTPNPQDVGGLPELPEPWIERGCNAPIMAMNDYYTADQMRAYGERCRAAPAGGDDWPFVEEIGTNGKPTGYWIRKGSPAAARMSAPAGSGEVEGNACDCCGLRIEDEAKLRDAVSTLADFNPGADEFSEALQTLANARFPSQTSPDQSGQVEGLIGEWSADAANLRRNGVNAPWFDQGQASALERCADNLRDALLRTLSRVAVQEGE